MKSLVFSFAVMALAGAVLPGAARDRDEGPMPDLDGALAWLNSGPLNRKALRGKVVLVNFWTYSCINSLRELPYMKAWAAKYKDAGLVVIGVHSPEFAFETEPSNVKTAVSVLKVPYPIPIDSNHTIWNSFQNEYWPADYFIDAKGRIRYHHFGEGEYDRSERVIQALLKENGSQAFDERLVRISAAGPEAPPSDDVQSPETYVGYARALNFRSPGRIARDARRIYSPPAALERNQWGLAGSWRIGPEHAMLESVPGKIVFRFHARDVHMVLGPPKNRTAVRFKVTLNGAAPAGNHGSDSAADGTGTLQLPRMYQLIRQQGSVQDSTFEIEFLDPGVEAFSFTFG